MLLGGGQKELQGGHTKEYVGGSRQLCDVRIRCDLDYLEKAGGQSQGDVRVWADAGMHGELGRGCQVSLYHVRQRLCVSLWIS
jgi:hypothetical protein